MRRNQVKEAYRLCLLAIEHCDDLRGFRMLDVDMKREPTYDDFLSAHNYEIHQLLKSNLAELARLMREDLGKETAYSVEEME